MNTVLMTKLVFKAAVIRHVDLELVDLKPCVEHITTKLSVFAHKNIRVTLNLSVFQSKGENANITLTANQMKFVKILTALVCFLMYHYNIIIYFIYLLYCMLFFYRYIETHCNENKIN